MSVKLPCCQLKICIRHSVFHRLIFLTPRHQRCTSLLQQLHWFPISKRIFVRVCVCVCAHAAFAPSYILNYSSITASLSHSSSGTRIFKLQSFNRHAPGFRFLPLRSLHLEQPPPRRPALSSLENGTQDISLNTSTEQHYSSSPTMSIMWARCVVYTSLYKKTKQNKKTRNIFQVFVESAVAQRIRLGVASPTQQLEWQSSSWRTSWTHSHGVPCHRTWNHHSTRGRSWITASDAPVVFWTLKSLPDICKNSGEQSQL